MSKKKARKAHDVKIVSKTPQTPIQTLAPKEEVIPASWQKKLKEHRSTLLTILIVLAVGAIATSLITSAHSQKTRSSWEAFGKTLRTTQPDKIMSQEMKVKDLEKKTRQFVSDTIKDIASLGPQYEKVATNLDELPIVYLPLSLQREVLRRHNIANLESQLADGPSTTATPWVQYLLGHLYYQAGSVESLKKAEQYYNSVQRDAPGHMLSLNLEEVSYQLGQLKKDGDWYAKYPQAIVTAPAQESSKTAVLTTSKGKITIELWDKTCPTTATQFMNLAQAGFYNGLNFYRVDTDASSQEQTKAVSSVWTGCPLGNGKGGPNYTAKGEIKDVWMQRGVVAMDNYETAGQIGSRFFIMTKYRETPSPYAVLGKVKEGIEVADQLTMADVLLDVSIK